MGSYIFRLEKFHIDNTRAVHNDTDVVTFSLKVGDQPVQTQTKGMGNVNNGDHEVGLAFGPVSIDPATPVVLSFFIVNSGYPGSREGDVKPVLDSLSDAAEKVANAVYPLGPVWPLVNKIIHGLNTLFFVDCDGPVAGDRIPGPQAADHIPANTLTGADLDTLISSAQGTFSLTRSYPGTDSGVWCGSNSRYTVTWSVHSSVAVSKIDVAPGAATAGDYFFLFAKSADERIVYNRSILGQGGEGWTEVWGDGRTNAPPAAAAVGTYMFIVVRGLDGNIYLNQTGNLGQSFVGWESMNFNTDVAPGAAAAGGYVFFFAKSHDGRIFYNRSKLGQGAEGWVEVGGDGRTDASPAAAAVGTYMFIVIRGLDGNVYLNQTGNLGQSFVGWESMNFNTDVAPAAVAAGGYVFIFAKSHDGRIFYNRSKLGQGAEGWVEVGGDGRTDASPAAAAVGTYMFIAVKGLDGNIYLNQTSNLGQSFVGWR